MWLGFRERHHNWISLLLVVFSFTCLSYRDQFAMLAEGIARERFEMEVREKAQEKVRYYRKMCDDNQLYLVLTIIVFLEYVSKYFWSCFRVKCSLKAVKRRETLLC